MKKLKLVYSDHQLFQNELDGESFHFLQIHKDAFKRMFETQGHSFWLQYLTTFRSSILKFHSIRPKTDKPNFPWQVFDEVCIKLHEKFLEGKFSFAKQFCIDVAKVAEKADTFSSILSDSIASLNQKPKGTLKMANMASNGRRTPFNNNLNGSFSWNISSSSSNIQLYSLSCETKWEPFRNVFGEPDSGLYTTSKVVLQMPVFLKFVGSISELLRRWLKNDLADQAEDYWTIPEEILQADYKPFFYEFYLVTYWGEKLHEIFDPKVDIPWIKKIMKFRSRYPPSLEDLAEFFQNFSYDKSSTSKKKKKKKKTVQSSAMISKITHKNDATSTAENTNKAIDTNKQTIEKSTSKEKETDNKKEDKKKSDDTKISDTKTEHKEPKDNLKKDKSEKQLTNKTGCSGFYSQMVAADAAKKLEEIEKCDEEKHNARKAKADKQLAIKNGCLGYYSRLACKKMEELEKCGDEKAMDHEFLTHLANMHRILTDNSPWKPFQSNDSKNDTPVVSAENIKKPTKNSKSSKSSNLKTCANCLKKEEEPKMYKKCKRCKEENFSEPRYYCGKQCQIEDWQENHCNEHLRAGTAKK